MRIKLDENLPLSLVGILRASRHDAEHVFDEGLTGRDDLAVWAEAQVEDRFLITQHIRFANAHMSAPATHAGLMLIRMRNASSSELTRVIQSVFAEHDVELWRGCFVVVSGRKVRVRRA